MNDQQNDRMPTGNTGVLDQSARYSAASCAQPAGNVVHALAKLQRRPAHKSIFQLTVLSLVILFIGGGIALLLQLAGTHYSVPQAGAVLNVSGNQDADLSVVGQPSLPAATVDAIFSHLGSPMVGTGKVIEQVASQEHIDDAFALAVWWTETNDGASGVGLAYHNPGGVRGSIGYPSGSGGYTIYPSYAAAATYWFHLIRNNYVDRGLSTVYAISHPYVGTSSSYLWAGKVVALMIRYHAEAPPPSPTPLVTPRPTVSANTLRHHKMVAAIDADFSVLLREVQEPPRQAAAATIQPSAVNALPAGIEYMIVTFALLLALLIAAWGLRIDGTVLTSVERDLDTASRRGEWGDGKWGGPLWSPAVPDFNPGRTLSPSWATTRILPTSTTSSFAPTDHSPDPLRLSPGKHFPLRRTILLPSLPDTDALESEPIPTAIGSGSHPAGLLSRYGKTQQG